MSVLVETRKRRKPKYDFYEERHTDIKSYVRKVRKQNHIDNPKRKDYDYLIIRKSYYKKKLKEAKEAGDSNLSYIYDRLIRHIEDYGTVDNASEIAEYTHQELIDFKKHLYKYREVYKKI